MSLSRSDRCGAVEDGQWLLGDGFRPWCGKGVLHRFLIDNVGFDICYALVEDAITRCLEIQDSDGSGVFPASKKMRHDPVPHKA